MDLSQDASSRRLLIIHNPAAGRGGGQRLADMVRRLGDLGCTVTLRTTTQRGDAEQFARQATTGAFDAVVAAGGDGTANEVVNGLIAGGGGPALALLPLGHANLLAQEIGLDAKDAEAVARTIATGPARRMHLGLANGRHFVLMAGAGLDAHLVEGISQAPNCRTGKFAHLLESLRQAFGYDFPKLRVRANGQTHEGRMAVACRGRFTAPPRLDVSILPRAGLAGAMRYALAPNHLALLPEVTRLSADRIVIIGPRGAPLQGDGDIVARLPAEISVAPETFALIVPPGLA